jgi:quercetin dioxygenase-like cupin family protein
VSGRFVRRAEVELSDAWMEGDETARWRSGTGHGPSAGAQSSGSSLLEVPAGCRLPRHTDSAEETVVVLSGSARVSIDGEQGDAAAGDVVVIPRDVPHEVRNAGDEPLRFAAVYASTDVVTTYEDDVQPDGSCERKPVD